MKGAERVGLITDLHAGHEHLEENAVIDFLEDEAVDIFEREDVDKVICLGDMVHETDSEENDEWRLEQVRDILSSVSGADYYDVAGNHDVIAVQEHHFEGHRKINAGSYDILLIDTASNTPMDNIGMIGHEGIEFIKENAPEDRPFAIMSHFPMRYTENYQYSTGFAEHPEGVFAIDKYNYENLDITPNAEVFGHMHYSTRLLMDDKIVSRILPPVANLDEFFISNSHLFTFQPEESEWHDNPFHYAIDQQW